MNDKCLFCDGTRKEKDQLDCVWCDNSGVTNGLAPTVQRFSAVALRFATSAAKDYVSGDDFDRVTAERDSLKLQLDQCQARRKQFAAEMIDRMNARDEGIDALEQRNAELKRKHLRSCQIAIGKSQLAKERHAELIKFDEGMREISFVLGAGGYNAETLTADQLVEKVKWGLEHHASVQEQRLADAERRNAELVKLLGDVSESVTGRNGTFARIPADWFDSRDTALTKPEEAKS